jgi:uncharacterized protein
LSTSTSIATATPAMTQRQIIICLCIGAGAGIMSGLMGVGGGIVMVPLMTGLLAMTQHKAHGTSLAVIVFTAIAGAITYGWKGHTDILIAVELAAGAMVGARIGALAMSRIPARELRMAFGVFSFLVGLRLLAPLPTSLAAFDARTVAGLLVVVLLGLVAGILSGMLGVGGGIIMVPAMVLLLGLRQQDAQGISLLVIIPTAIVGARTHLSKGNVTTRFVPWIAVTSIVAAVIGSSLAIGPLKNVLTQIFAVFLLLVSTQMIVTAYRQKPKAAPAPNPLTETKAPEAKAPKD